MSEVSSNAERVVGDGGSSSRDATNSDRSSESSAPLADAPTESNGDASANVERGGATRLPGLLFPARSEDIDGPTRGIRPLV